MSKLALFCMTMTPFASNGQFDEDIAREFLNRQIDAGIGVYLGSGGFGEGHALSHVELGRVYRSGVAECKGKVPVQANLPEQHTVEATVEQAQIAIDAGIELLNIYTLEGRHGMRPTDDEIEASLDAVLTAITFPIAIAVSPSVLGYMPKATIIARACRKHRHVEAVRLHNVPDTYLIDLKKMIDRDIAYYFQFSMGNLNPLALGVDGLFAGEANILPKTCRRFIDSYEADDHAAMMQAYVDLRRFDQYNQKWLPGGARPLKMALKVLHLPGGEGGLRLPYLMPAETELRKYADGLLALGIGEIDELVRAGERLAAH